MNLSCTVLLPQSATALALWEEGSSPHWPPRGRIPAGRAPAHWEAVSFLPCPKTLMLMGLGEAHQPSKAWQQKMLGLSWSRDLRDRPPPAAFWGSGQPHLLSSRSSTCLVVAKAR